MKKKLTITIDSELIPVAKRYARQHGISLSALIERYLDASHPSLLVGAANFDPQKNRATLVTISEEEVLR